MTVSCSGVLGRWSDPHWKLGLITTLLGTKGALSVVFGAPSGSLKWYGKTASFQSTCPSIARA